MKVTQWTKSIVVILAATGTIVPHASVQAAESMRNGQRIEKSAETFSDVALASDGMLRGQVVNSAGKGVAGSTVTLQNQNQDALHSTTDSQGRFAVSGLKGGVYTVSTQNGTQLYRVWTNRMAPPTAVREILLVNDAHIVRGQLLGGGGTFGGVALGTLMLGGLIAGITAASISHTTSS